MSSIIPSSDLAIFIKKIAKKHLNQDVGQIILGVLADLVPNKEGYRVWDYMSRQRLNSTTNRPIPPPRSFSELRLSYASSGYVCVVFVESGLSAKWPLETWSRPIHERDLESMGIVVARDGRTKTLWF